MDVVWPVFTSLKKKKDASQGGKFSKIPIYPSSNGLLVGFFYIPFWSCLRFEDVKISHMY